MSKELEYSSELSLLELIEIYPDKKKELLMQNGYKFAVIKDGKELGWFTNHDRAQRFASLFENADVLKIGN